MITQKQAKELFSYKNGRLFRKTRASKSNHIGDEAGCQGTIYRKIHINYEDYPTHRIVFLMHHGYLPKYLDHIDNNPLNNKIENLRECTHQQNMYNQKIRKDNTSGIKGVSWHKAAKKWSAKICVNKKPIHLGVFEDLELAELVINEAREVYHGEFARYS